ncbi:ferredoxin [Streptomyces sp. UNOC14_S4]|uniref:ferredoxin n=1 Tax=Streptomyces sp. UNOC14_S4 TaxID=2872340 RepID=UPI001E3FC8CB|nr:ferredoxin [Streptomyces sp. UNOC14_S4]MCC3768184.1 ferredoxin [Streptomyces sp. UNOC14_S4]
MTTPSPADLWQLSVDHYLCVGSGLCAATAPGAFRLDELRRSRAVEEVTTPSAAVLEAAEGCPVEAITIRGSAGEAVFPSEE